MQIIRDARVIADSMRDTVEPQEPSVRIVHYSGGYALVRGHKVLESHPYMSLAVVRKIQIEESTDAL